MTSRDRSLLADIADDPLVGMIRDANPVADAFAQPAPSYDVDRLIDEILDDRRELSRGAKPAPTRRRWRRRHKVAAAAGVLVLAAGGTAAAVGLLGSDPTQPSSPTACRADLRLDAAAVLIPASSDPVEACRALWISGELPDPDIAQPGDPADSPPLVACVGDGGAVEVFPADDPSACSTLGLEPLSSTRSADAQRVLMLQDALVAATADCISVDEAVAVAERELAALGLRDWIVAPHPDVDGSATCARVGIDAAARTVRLGAGN